MHALLAAIVAAATPFTVHVVDGGGKPIAGARVVVRADGAIRETETTDAHGDARIAHDATGATLDVRANGFAAATRAAPADAATAFVVRLAPTEIGRVRVATGSARDLHRLALPVATLDQATIAATPALATDDLLRTLPGFDRTRSNSAFTNYGQLRVSFGGAGNDRGIVLADGIPAQDGFGGQVDWLAYPPASLASVELLRGSGSALYGAGGVGGVLSLNGYGPNADSTAPADGAIDLTEGTQSLADADVRLRFALAPHLTTSVVAETRRERSADLAPGYQSPIDQAALAVSSSTRARLRYAFGDSALDIGTLFAYDAQQEGRPNYTFDRVLSQNDMRFTSVLGSARVEATAYERTGTIDNLADLAPVQPGALRYLQTVPTREGGASASLFATFGPNELALRIDTRYVHGDSSQYAPDGTFTARGTGSQHDAGLALQDTYEAGRFEALAGLRGDRVLFASGQLVNGATTTIAPQRDDAVLSPRAALRYDASPAVAIRLSGGGAFREPFVNELVRGYQIGSIVYTPNPSLVPERSRTVAGGIDALVGVGRLSFDVTTTRVANAITFVTLSPTLQMRENIGRTQTDGVTATYEASIARCIAVRASATAQNARVVAGQAAVVGKQLAFIPDRSASIGVDSGNAIRYGTDVSLLGTTYADDRNVQPLGTAILVGAYVSAPAGGGTTITLQGTNLGGARYLSSIDRYGPAPVIALKLRVPLGPAPRAASSTCPPR